MLKRWGSLGQHLMGKRCGLCCILLWKIALGVHGEPYTMRVMKGVELRQDDIGRQRQHHPTGCGRAVLTFVHRVVTLLAALL